MRARPRSASGFTLIEVVVAILIVAITLVAALATYGAELRTLARARQVTVAVELAEDRLAAIELFAADRLPNLPDSLSRGVFSDPFSEYAWSADATAVPGHPVAEVIVQVTWSSGARSLATVLPRRDAGAGSP
jgi:general secretion pathway protein I